MKRGALIVFEGCDRSGKSTQCRKLVEHFNSTGTPAELWRFPERSTDIGGVINGYIAKTTELHDKAVHLLFSANRWEHMSKMKDKLESGITLIVDRYAYSGVAFTAAKGYAIAWCKTCDTGLPRPDLVIYMNIDVDQASGRGGFGEERYEISDFQKKAQNIFQQLKDPSWQVINASQSIEKIHLQIKELTTKKIEECQNTEVKDTLFVD